MCIILLIDSRAPGSLSHVVPYNIILYLSMTCIITNKSLLMPELMTPIKKQKHTTNLVSNLQALSRGLKKKRKMNLPKPKIRTHAEYCRRFCRQTNQSTERT